MSFGIYLNSLSGRFIWDEEFLIENNRHIKEWIGIKNIFIEDAGAGADIRTNFYRPLQALTYMIDYSFWRLNPIGYHFTNICLHVFVALSIYWLICLIFANQNLAFITGLLFLMHPVHTQTVTYIASRADLLVALFALLSINFYIKQLFSRSPANFVLILFSYILAIFSKEYALVVPAILIMYSFIFKKKIILKEFLSILSISFIYVLLRLTILRFGIPPGEIIVTTLYQRLSGFFIAITEYLRLLFLPFDLHMEYVFRPFSFMEPKAILGFAALLAVSIYVFRKKRTNKLISFSILWFFITLLPYSNIYPINAYMSEHWLYLASIGFFLILAQVITRIFEIRKARWVSILLVVFIIVFYASLTIKQNNHWKDGLTFNKQTLRFVKNSPKIYNNLCQAYIESGRYEDAIINCKRAIELKPDFISAYYNLAYCYQASGNYEDAIAVYRKIARKETLNKTLYFNLGVAYEKINNKEEAIASYGKAIEIDQNYLEALNNLASLYSENERIDDAIRLWNRAIKINPKFATAHFNLAVFYFEKGDYDLAVKHCDNVIVLGNTVDPKFLELLKPYRK